MYRGIARARLRSFQWPLKCAAACGVTWCAARSAQTLAGSDKPVEPVPNPDWKPGDGNLGRRPLTAAKDMVRVAPAELDPGKSAYALLISAVVPRPIAFVSSQSASGEVNLAPFSFFGLMCHDPPTLMFCTVHRKGCAKDTLANCQETGECVVNIISEDFVEAANVCSGEFPPEVDEFEMSGLTKVPSEMLKSGTPRVGEAMVQMECKVINIQELIGREGNPTASIVQCEIQAIYLDPSVHRQTSRGSDYVDFEALKPISRLGANDYARSGDTFAMDRPPADLEPPKK